LHKAELDRLSLRLKSAEGDRLSAIQATKDENEALLKETRERWQAELAAERLKAAQQMELIDANVAKQRQIADQKKDALTAVAEERIRQEMEIAAKARNEKKLQLVVQKLEEETNAMRKKLEEEAERKINESQAEARRTLAVLETERDKNQTQLNGLKKEIENEKTICCRLEQENERLLREMDAQREYKEQLQTSISEKEKQIEAIKEAHRQKQIEEREHAEAEKTSLRQQVDEARAVFENQKQVWARERQDLEAKNQAELNAVSKKVKSLLETKEQTIQSLKDQLGAAQSRLREIEELFHQQKRTVMASKK
jgi:5-azacytidine-induced protein 1